MREEALRASVVETGLSWWQSLALSAGHRARRGWHDGDDAETFPGRHPTGKPRYHLDDGFRGV